MVYSAFFVIGQSNNGTLVLVLWHSIENFSKGIRIGFSLLHALLVSAESCMSFAQQITDWCRFYKFLIGGESCISFFKPITNHGDAKQRQL